SAARRTPKPRFNAEKSCCFLERISSSARSSDGMTFSSRLLEASRDVFGRHRLDAEIDLRHGLAFFRRRRLLDEETRQACDARVADDVAHRKANLEDLAYLIHQTNRRQRVETTRKEVVVRAEARADHDRLEKADEHLLDRSLRGAPDRHRVFWLDA